MWMPRQAEIKAQGRSDLANAVNRFGGTKKFAQMAGLVPFYEWHFFEGQYELLVLLKEYIDKHYNSSSNNGKEDSSLKYKRFPCVSQMRTNGYGRLYRLIQFYGGGKLLSSRLGMTNDSSHDDEHSGISWGGFSIQFAIELCDFIRKDHMRAKPPVPKAMISIPSEARLKRAGPKGEWLHERILAYGGYENVARRLYLEYSFHR